MPKNQNRWAIHQAMRAAMDETTATKLKSGVSVPEAINLASSLIEKLKAKKS